MIKQLIWIKSLKEDLPDEMKNLNAAERKAYLDKKAAERKAIQEKIQQLNAERRIYIAAEESKMANKKEGKP